MAVTLVATYGLLVASGDRNTRELIPIRRDQEAQERVASLRQALLEGEDSGTPGPLDMTAVKQAARTRPKTTG